MMRILCEKEFFNYVLNVNIVYGRKIYKKYLIPVTVEVLYRYYNKHMLAYELILLDRMTM